MSDRRFWFSMLLVLAVALGVRVGVATWWQGRLDRAGERFAMGDSESYWILAGQIAAGLPYQYGSDAVFRAPGYPLVLASVVDPDDPRAGLLAARLIGCTLGTVAVWMIIGICRWLFDRPAAIVAGLLAAAYPGAVTMSVLVLSEALFIPLMIGVLWVLAAMIPRGVPLVEDQPTEDQPRGWTLWSLAAGAGVLSGLAVLVRPSWLLFLPFYFALRLVVAENRRREAGLAIVALVALAVTMTPWWIRNYRVTGHFVATTLQVGASLYDGLHEGASGASDTGMRFSGEFRTRLRREAAASDRPLDSLEYRLDRRLASEAIRWARENPGEVFRLAGRKIARTWWPWPSAAELPGGAVVRWIFALGAIGIAVAAVVGGVRMRFWRGSLFPLLVPVLYFTLLHAVFVGSVRYRQPALMAAIVLAGPQCVHWWRRIAGRT